MYPYTALVDKFGAFLSPMGRAEIALAPLFLHSFCKYNSGANEEYLFIFLQIGETFPTPGDCEFGLCTTDGVIIEFNSTCKQGRTFKSNIHLFVQLINSHFTLFIFSVLIYCSVLNSIV